jgi:dipeptidyl aminopeptidase/acylaminoacyl peptidase
MAPPHREPGRRYPALLNIHGGPHTQYGNRFFDEFQLQAAAGFVVVYSNPRGSSGSTEAAARSTRWPEAAEDPGSGWGGVDYDDVMAVIETAVATYDFIDPDRLGVLGGSYGGYMTSWIVGHNDRFRAACSERSANNLLSLEQSSDAATAFRTLVGVSHLDNPDAYLRQSPVSYVRSMTTPLLLMHSDNDLRCPASQAEELFVALRLLGRNPELVRFPGESHELSRSGSPRHRVMRAEIILDWFRRHLMTEAPAG